MPCLETAANPSVPQLSSPEHRLNALHTEHDDLDAAIVALLGDSMFDSLLVTRLKKRKLHIRDEIASLLTQLGAEPAARAS